MRGEAPNINVALIVGKNLYLFLLGNRHFLWHVPVALVNGNRPLNYIFLRDVSKGIFLASKCVYECKPNSICLCTHRYNSALGCLDKRGNFKVAGELFQGWSDKRLLQKPSRGFQIGVTYYCQHKCSPLRPSLYGPKCPMLKWICIFMRKSIIQGEAPNISVVWIVHKNL